MTKKQASKRISLQKTVTKKSSREKRTSNKVIKKIKIPFVYKCPHCEEEEKIQRFHITMLIEKLPN